MGRVKQSRPTEPISCASGPLCLAGDNPQPAEEFLGEHRRPLQHCRTCRKSGHLPKKVRNTGTMALDMISYRKWLKELAAEVREVTKQGRVL